MLGFLNYFVYHLSNLKNILSIIFKKLLFKQKKFTRLSYTFIYLYISISDLVDIQQNLKNIVIIIHRLNLNRMNFFVFKAHKKVYKNFLAAIVYLALTLCMLCTAHVVPTQKKNIDLIESVNKFSMKLFSVRLNLTYMINQYFT